LEREKINYDHPDALETDLRGLKGGRSTLLTNLAQTRGASTKKSVDLTPLFVQ
jgi:hypothetical protein